jgi:hypothetical protein
MKACIVSLSLALAASPTAAQTTAAATTTVVLGSGNITCAEFAKARGERTVVAVAAQNWVLGYLSAYNQFVAAAQGDVSLGHTINGVLAQLDSRCDANPRETVQHATVALLEDLKRREPTSADPDPTHDLP